jgi:hypothetical protein
MKKTKLIEKHIRKNSKLKDFITPDYERYCVSNIPNTVLSILDVKNKRNKIPKKDIEKQTDGIKKVVVFLIDSLGYNHFLKFIRKNKNGFFNDMVKKGEFFPLTSTFPSITPVTLSSYATGLTPQETGIVSTTFYHEKIKKVIKVLHFSTYEEDPVNLKYMGIKPKKVLGPTIFEKMKKNKIKPFIINYEEFIGTDFNEMIYKGSKQIPYGNHKEMYKELKKTLKSSGKIFIFCYLFEIDMILHDFGEGKILYDEIKEISKGLENFIRKIDEKTSKETLLIIASDHGQMKLSKKKMIFLEDHQYIMKNISVPPMGGIRSVFLKTKKNKKKQVKKYLKNKFKGKALILDIEEIEKKKLSGLKKMTKKNHQRMGDLLILPYKNYSFIAPFKQDQRHMNSQHGGLSEEEMLVPFVCVKLSNLKN